MPDMTVVIIMMTMMPIMRKIGMSKYHELLYCCVPAAPALFFPFFDFYNIILVLSTTATTTTTREE